MNTKEKNKSKNIKQKYTADTKSGQTAHWVLCMILRKMCHIFNFGNHTPLAHTVVHLGSTCSKLKYLSKQFTHKPFQWL